MYTYTSGVRGLFFVLFHLQKVQIVQELNFYYVKKDLLCVPWFSVLAFQPFDKLTRRTKTGVGFF